MPADNKAAYRLFLSLLIIILLSGETLLAVEREEGKGWREKPAARMRWHDGGVF